MAINRTAFNALIDDDGSGTTGSVWNKSAIAGVVLDPVDAAINPVNAPSTSAHTIGGPLSVNTTLRFTGSQGIVVPDTADGADSTYLALCGGGGSSQTRGGFITVGGNEQEGLGRISLVPGAPAGTIYLYRGSDTTLAVQLDAQGVLTLHAGALKFPATQVPSADATTLDDYREMIAWTPAILGTGGQSGQTYSAQLGRAIKIGRWTAAYGYLQLSNKGTVTGDVLIGGLPVTADPTTVLLSISPIMFDALATNWMQIVGLLHSGQPNALALRGIGAAASTTNNTAVTGADLSNSTQFIVAVQYVAAS